MTAGVHGSNRSADLVSVIIPVFNGADVLPAQLRALAQQAHPGEMEVIVADNGSTDATRRVAGSWVHLFEELRVVDASRVRGPSYARNVGSREARGELLLFCDADDVVSDSWVEAMRAAALDADLLAGVGLETSDPEHHVWARTTLRPPTSFRFLPWHGSANLGFRREVFEAIGGFDESRTVAEDVDICWRAQLAGYRFAHVPGARVAYRERATMTEALARQFRFGRAAPALYRDFAESGGPPPGLGWLIGSTFDVLRGAPRALLSTSGRKRWTSALAGLGGRWVGIITLAIRGPRRH